MDIPQEELQGCQSLNPDWPRRGVIEFHNVTLRYMPSLPAALCDITFTVGEGMQVSAYTQLYLDYSILCRICI